MRVEDRAVDLDQELQMFFANQGWQENSGHLEWKWRFLVLRLLWWLLRNGATR